MNNAFPTDNTVDFKDLRGLPKFDRKVPDRYT